MKKLVLGLILVLSYMGNSSEGCEWVRYRGVVVQPVVTPVIQQPFVWTYVQQTNIQYVPRMVYEPVVRTYNVPVMVPVIPVAQYPVVPVVPYYGYNVYRY